MQSPNSSPSPSPSPKHPPSPASNTNTDNPPAAPAAGDKGKGLSKSTLRISSHGSPSHADAASPEDLHVPIRELVALGSGQGGSAAKHVDEPVMAGRSKKIRLHLKRKPAVASASPGCPICLFCLRRFSTRADLLDHLQTEHCTSHEQGEGKGGGDSGAAKKSQEGSSAATERNDGLDLNRPAKEVQVSDETIDGPRKKFRFDLNELPPEDEEDENWP